MTPYALAALQLIAVVAGYAAVAAAFVAFVRWLDRVQSAESFAETFISENADVATTEHQHVIGDGRIATAINRSSRAARERSGR